MLFPKFSEKNHANTKTKTLKKVTNLTKNDEPLYSKNAQLNILNLW